MKWQTVIPLLLALGLTFGGAAIAADTTGKDGIYVNESADGSIELSNISSTDNQKALIAAPPATAVSDPAAGTDDASKADQPKDVREQYRDRMLGGANADGTPTTASNPAISRRYKMMDKETYRANVLGNTNGQSALPVAQPDSATH